MSTDADARAASTGSYGGLTAQQRRDRRREQLLAAGLEIFGTAGYARTSVKSICAQAGLTERYFYESFKRREDLLFAVYEMVATELQAEVFGAAEAAGRSVPRDATEDDELAVLTAQIRAGMSTFFKTLTDDLRRARVLSFEVVGVNQALELRRRQTIHAFADFLVDLDVATGTPENSLDRRLLALSLVGGVNELLIEWVLGNLGITIDELIDHCSRSMLAVARGRALGG